MPTHATNHYEDSVFIPANSREVFEYIDDHSKFSSHMSRSSWMMGGGHMDVRTDDGRGQKIGSHIILSGKAFGIGIYLDEVITEHDPPLKKIWQTVGNPKLLIIGHYQMGLNINKKNSGSDLRVFIDYELPSSGTRWLGYIFGGAYAKWCVKQILQDTQKHFTGNMITRS